LSVEVILVILSNLNPPFLPTRFLTTAALLRRCSPLRHHLLRLVRLLSDVPALSLPLINHNLLAIRLYPCESCQLYTIIFRGTKSALREPKQETPLHK
jgi:hypothetical protein